MTTFGGFDRAAGPQAPGGPNSRPPPPNFRSPPPPSSSPPTPPFFNSAPLRSPRPIVSPPRLDDKNKYLSKDYEAQIRQRPSASVIASRNSGSSATFKVARSQDPKRTRSPPSLSSNSQIARHPSQAITRGGSSDLGCPNHIVPQRTRSPPLAFEKNHSVEDFRPSFVEAQRPASFSIAMNNWPKLPGNYANSVARQDQSSFLPYLGSYDSGRTFSTAHEDVQIPKRISSPHLSSANEVPPENSHFARNGSKRSSISPPTLGSSPNFLSTTESQIHQRISPPPINTVPEVAATKLTSSPVPKRTRSPPLPPTGQVFLGDSYSTDDGTEREMQAKAKRLARFKVELSETMQSNPDFTDQKASANRHEQPTVERQKYVGNHSTELTGAKDHVLSEHEGLQLSTIIIGSCPDMCPESERGERERKGDLDQYERFNGDRNQTSKSLAVKKYTRTAEREASLIRPMPILQKTIGYLLNLLDQPYDDRFLGIYNFLWDRMRAIRMDLRMQHIFNQGAIVMLEQMIRLHIIAMHELCEYTKGEGFSEGFDAHLNIEQMNKTSVDLFQMYDDHRKRGINVPTEKEFRGYYALLKLDKHPGYKVEPAELSLDLAKMTPEIRQTPEVLFARDVARACRTGNFIAFFRLARKASYLQACLMHAHFSKLRTQALASLHSGLHQGLPVAHISKWLGMEEEDVESLLEYHGFSIKAFEEPYMMKEGPFLNRDKDYPTKCSELVRMKKSRRIVEDISPSTQVTSLPAETTKGIQVSKIYQHDPISIPSVERESPACTIDDEMPDLGTVSSPKDGPKLQQIIRTPRVGQQIEDDSGAAGTSIFPWGFSFSHASPKPQLTKVGILGKPNCDALVGNFPERNVHCNMEETPVQIVSKIAPQEKSLDGKYDYSVENSGTPSVVINSLEDEEPSGIHQENETDEIMTNNHDEETAVAKLKLILRLWRRHSSKRRELREQRQLAASAALNSLSLGPPLRQNKDQPSNFSEFDIDRVTKERYKKHVQSWSRLNVSDVIADTLIRRNPDAKCICWKIIVCSQMNNLQNTLGEGSQAICLEAGWWLLGKLIPSSINDSDDDLVISSPSLSIWRKWIPSQSGADVTCCLSVVKDTELDNPDETVSGASAVLFLVSKTIPWKLQKVQLHNLLISIPSGSCLPLLILSGSYKEELSDSFSIMVNELGLYDIDKSRISSFQVVPLVMDQNMEHSDGFFSDERLREGLKWLASESPLQPVLHNVKTRELVLSHLNSSLEMLERINDYEVGPNKCISAFNEALEWSLGEIAATAAKVNPASWPCPELAALEEYSNERRMVMWNLPSIGWNSLAKTEPLISALRDCKLPIFPDDMSWLARGSNTGEEIKRQRLELENCLVRYLIQSSKMMRIAQAVKVAGVMVQKSSRLELRNSSYCIVPKWVTIFRPIFNWRLMSLSSGAFSKAYILESYHVAPPTSGDMDKFSHEDSIPSPYYLNHPSLDEMIEVGCSSFLSGGDQTRPEGVQSLPRTVSNGEIHQAADTSDLVEDEIDFARDGKLAITYDASCTNELNNSSSQIMVVGKATKEAENNLSMLLEQCDIMQNRVDDKLYIYF